MTDQWQPISTAPKGVWILAWWIPVDGNAYSEAPVIVQISVHENEMWWDGSVMEYRPMTHLTHWQPLPSRPKSRGPDANDSREETRRKWDAGNVFKNTSGSPIYKERKV